MALWKKWIPGVLSNNQLLALAEAGMVTRASGGKVKADPSAIDLHIASECYQVTRGSVKPSGESYFQSISAAGLVEMCSPDSLGAWVLTPNRTYLFKIDERLSLKGSPIFGQATAKSSVGRVDVLARLIVDGMDHYERFDPDKLEPTSEMFLEVTPITFAVQVRPGVSLNQLRLFYGHPTECELRGKEISNTCLEKDVGTLTVDLRDTEVNGIEGCGFQALPPGMYPPIPLWEEKGKHPSPAEHWRMVGVDDRKRLSIDVDKFYILRSKERLRVPPGVAVYARAIDEEIGEMRIHYAGFAHPFFGWERDDGREGTPLIFEVRGHNVPVSLSHGEVLARLQFFRMSDQPTPEPSPYDKQELTLSKFFAKWSTPPNKIQS